MVKSKFRIWGFIPYLILALCITTFFFWLVIHGYDEQKESQIIYILFITVFLAMSAAIVITLINNLEDITIDQENAVITIKNIITRKTKQYSFSELDGYLDCIQTTRNGSFNAIYLVKNSVYVQRISARFYSNYKVLEDGLKDIKYIGFVEFKPSMYIDIFVKSKMPSVEDQNGI